MGSRDDQHQHGPYHGGVNRTLHAHSHPDDENVAEDRVSNPGDRHGGGSGFRPVIGIDKEVERPLAEHDRHKNQLRTDIGPLHAVFRIRTQNAHQLRLEDKPERYRQKICAEQQLPDRLKNPVPFFGVPLCQGTRIVDGTADGKPVAEDVIKQIDRLSEADGGQAGGTDAVADENTVGNSRYREPEAGQQRRNIKTAKGAAHKVTASLSQYPFFLEFLHSADAFFQAQNTKQLIISTIVLHCQEIPIALSCHAIRLLSTLMEIPLIIMCRKMLPQMLLQRS